MRKYYFFGMLLILHGCSYSDGCWYAPQSVYCSQPRTNYPYLAALQKPESLGNTNSEKRWSDAIACGLKYGDDNVNWTFRDINNPYSEINIEGRKQFYACMERKGYITVYGECGYQEKPTGKCNL